MFAHRSSNVTGPPAPFQQACFSTAAEAIVSTHTDEQSGEEHVLLKGM